VFPLIDGKPVPPNQVGKMVEEGKFPKDQIDSLYKRYQGYKVDLRNVLKQVRQINRELAEKTASIEKEVLRELLSDVCTDIAEHFAHPGVREYLCEIQDFIIENPGIFGQDEEEAPRPNVPMPFPIPGAPDEAKIGDPFRIFKVNIVRDGAAEDPCPVIIEQNPTYLNLFGNVEREWRIGGFWSTDFMMIKGGSLLRADGGYIVLNVMDVLQEPLAWRSLMRALKTCSLQIQAPEAILSIAPSSIKPEPIELNVTVILIGDSWVYHLLSEYETDFARIFKVRADFDALMPRGKAQIGYYAALASKLVNDDGLLHASAAGVARLAEEGARMAGRGGKMSARLGEVADVLREASHHARMSGSKVINAEHVDMSVKGREYRQDLIRERIGEAIDDGIIMIDTKGSVVGQVNGLAVHDLGTFAFGRPTRITCEVSMGDGGVINIEREAKLSGRIHDKGVLILEGYLRHTYGQDGPITLSASIAFEQSYAQVDGDSATLAEVLALTSVLSGLPLRQDLAVTGSVNQKGEVQAIGGINEKIEGFFRACKSMGLTGTQGVIIPKSNIGELMLSDEVLDAVGEGMFSVVPVSTVNQALEAFTGVKAGGRLAKGGFTKGSVHNRVDMTLAHFYWAGKVEGEKKDQKGDGEPKMKKPTPSRRRRKKDDDGGEPTDPRDTEDPDS
jgi:ATP-dependent Lon protease